MIALDNIFHTDLKIVGFTLVIWERAKPIRYFEGIKTDIFCLENFERLPVSMENILRKKEPLTTPANI